MHKINKKICVIGLGYIGLPTAVMLADHQIEVIGVDINETIVTNLNKNIVHIEESGLNNKISKALDNGFFKAQNSLCESDIFLITVPTPIKINDRNEKEPNIDYVIDAINAIAPFYKEDNLVILESTCPVGTTKKAINILEKKTSIKSEKILFAYCPERVIPGSTFNELINNSRVIGANNIAAGIAAKSFYQIFCKGDLSLTNPETAELVKLTENSFRDINIAFANEISIICSEIGIDTKELINLANKHPRVNILNPGCGVGGHCIALDPLFIVSSFPELSTLIKTSRETNERKTNWVFEKIFQKAKNISKFKNKDIKIGILGISYKPNISDLRESPALKIVNKLILEGYDLMINEPNIKYHSSYKLFSLDEINKKCDVIIKLVNHNEFINLESKLEIIDFS